MTTITQSVVNEFVEEKLKPAIEKGYVHDRDSLNEEYSEHLYDLISLKGPGLIVEENSDFHFSGTMISDEVIGMYSAYSLIFDMALEILKEEVRLEIKKQGLLDI